MAKVLRWLQVVAVLMAAGLAAAQDLPDDEPNDNWGQMERTYHNGIYVYTSHRSKRDAALKTSPLAQPRASAKNENFCWQFTWISEEENGTKPDCFQKTKEGSPCFEPIVITEDGTEPDIDQLEDALLQAGVDKFTCNRQKGLCMRFTYYQNNDVPFNASWFCGTVDKKDGTPGTYGVYTEILSGSLKRTLQYCDGPLCNAASVRLPTLLALSSSLLLLWVR